MSNPGWHIDVDEPETFSTYFVVRAIHGAENGGRFSVELRGDAARHLKVFPSIDRTYVAPGTGKGFTVMLFSENNFPLSLTGEVVIESLDCGVHTIIPVTIGRGMGLPKCDDATMTVRTYAANWVPFDSFYYEDRFSEPFAGISRDKVAAVHDAEFSIQFVNRETGDDTIPTFTADVDFANTEVRSFTVSTGSPEIRFDVHNAKNALLQTDYSGDGEELLVNVHGKAGDVQTDDAWYDDYLVPDDVQLETTFSFEQCLMLPDEAGATPRGPTRRARSAAGSSSRGWDGTMGQCTYCGSAWKSQRDHVIARSKGDSTTVTACAACNQSKGSKPLMVWLRWLKRNERYRWNRIVAHNAGKRSVIAHKVHRVRDER